MLMNRSIRSILHCTQRVGRSISTQTRFRWAGVSQPTPTARAAPFSYPTELPTVAMTPSPTGQGGHYNGWNWGGDYNRLSKWQRDYWNILWQFMWQAGKHNHTYGYQDQEIWITEVGCLGGP